MMLSFKAAGCRRFMIHKLATTSTTTTTPTHYPANVLLARRSWSTTAATAFLSTPSSSYSTLSCSNPQRHHQHQQWQDVRVTNTTASTTRARRAFSKKAAALEAPLKFVLGSHKWQQLQQSSQQQPASGGPAEPPMGNDGMVNSEGMVLTEEHHQQAAQEISGSRPDSIGKNTNYDDILETAVLSGVTTVEMGQGDGADGALLRALQEVYGQDLQNAVPTTSQIHVLKRVGYRTVEASSSSSSLLAGDVQVGQEDGGQEPAPGSSDKDDNKTVTTIVHNLGPQGIQQALDDSPLVKAIQQATTTGDESSSQPNDTKGVLVGQTSITLMLHNPEEQGMLHYNAEQEQGQPNNSDASVEDRQARIRDKLVESFLHCEAVVADPSQPVSAYGIVSNGLCLPESHPLHLSWSLAVLPALRQAQEELATKTNGSANVSLNLTSIALPLNLLETRGLTVAQQIRFDTTSTLSDLSFANGDIDILALRPLTAYPDQGTGASAGNAFVLADYKLPASMKKEVTWSNEMTAPPQVYQMAMQRAIRHFDDYAQSILQMQMDGHQLDAEERESLDGCKLMQSIIHDVDNGLEQVRSFKAHEDFLSQRIIPLMYDTFEGYDEETARLLESFFGCYSLAVRYAIARNTRQLLKQGEEDSLGGGNATPTYPDLPDDLRLQDFAIRFLLSQTYESQRDKEVRPLIDKVIVGCVEVDQVLEDLEIVYQYLLSRKDK